jgi:hypothetical protein
MMRDPDAEAPIAQSSDGGAAPDAGVTTRSQQPDASTPPPKPTPCLAPPLPTTNKPPPRPCLSVVRPPDKESK